MKVLVTGGTGYIGSHTLLVLLEAGFDVVVLDNLSNSSTEPLQRISKLTGFHPAMIEGDVRDEVLLRHLFSAHKFDAVLHFAGLKAVGESVDQPLKYFDNNVNGSLSLLRAMAEAGVYQFVFSSSATVYGDPPQVPISELCTVGSPTNPYGRSKLMVENMLWDLAKSDPRWCIAILRYFNPVGAHQSGLIGEDPNGVPNNLLPFIAQVAVGKLNELSVFGNDYPTPDGTGVRDYIHVMDLAEGHLSALRKLQHKSGIHLWNLGTGQGFSVLQMLQAFEAASGVTIPYRVVPRRAGDIATCFADPSKAHRELGWKAKRGLPEMMQDTWRWQRLNPNGYSQNCQTTQEKRAGL